MNTNYLPSFIRDLKALKKTPIYNTIKTLAFEEIPSYESLDQITASSHTVSQMGRIA